MPLPDGGGTAAVPDDAKAVTAYLRAGSNAPAPYFSAHRQPQIQLRLQGRTYGSWG